MFVDSSDCFIPCLFYVVYCSKKNIPNDKKDEENALFSTPKEAVCFCLCWSL